MTEHWWAYCQSPTNCGWESPCYPKRAAAVGAAGQHMRKHEREGMAVGVRASTRVKQHDVVTLSGQFRRPLCEAVPA